MPNVDIAPQVRLPDPRSYEVLGRVLSVLCVTPGPLGDTLAFQLWPLFTGAGFALSWRGHPAEDDVVIYLLDAAADNEVTTVLEPGDVVPVDRGGYTSLTVRGVVFQLRPEPMLHSDDYAALEQYWRTGKMPTPSTERRRQREP